ncbi:MAG: hypothetical protein WD069_17610 [Planctomycetales bacterium]
MTHVVQELLETFDRLPEPQKREAASEILRRVREFDYDLPSDEELVQAAEESFLALDREEGG